MYVQNWTYLMIMILLFALFVTLRYDHYHPLYSNAGLSLSQSALNCDEIDSFQSTYVTLVRRVLLRVFQVCGLLCLLLVGFYDTY